MSFNNFDSVKKQFFTVYPVVDFLYLFIFEDPPGTLRKSLPTMGLVTTCVQTDTHAHIYTSSCTYTYKCIYVSACTCVCVFV